MLNQIPIITEKVGAVDYHFNGGEIELRNVGFKHLLSAPDESSKKNSEQTEKTTDSQARNEYLFQDLTLNIKAGTSNAIVGPSGFGKTTIIHMINRLYDPAEGEVFIDG